VPTYEFRCPNGHDSERFYKTISAAPSDIDCPDCGAKASRRLSGGAGLLFKGSGFYLTDYGKNAHRKSEPEKQKGGEKADKSTPAETGASGGADLGGATRKSDGAAKSDTKSESKAKDAGKAETPKSKPGAKPKTE
jgi:putative FmdB family regulatory protein